MLESAVVERQARRTAASYQDHRGYVLGVLARRCGWLAADEREALLHDAWTVLLEKERDGSLDVAAMRPPQVRAYLTQTAINKALDEGRRARAKDEPLGDRDDFEAAGEAPDEVADAQMEGARLREIVGELSPRQQTIVKLRFFFDRSPGEIQELLGLTERAYRRDLERAMALVSERYELVREGRFCDSRLSLIRAYVAGIAGPNRTREAREHLATCPACRRFALDLRRATGKVAVLLPLPVFADGGARGRFAHVLELFSGPRDATGQALSGAREQAAMLSTRVGDGSPLTAFASARPGSVIAALSACVAVGSGGAYCALNGLPHPLPRSHQHEVARHPPKAASVHRVKPPAATQAARPVTPVTRTAAATTRSSAPSASKPKRSSTARARTSSAKPRADPVVAAQEFGIEGAGTTVQRSSGSSAVTAPARRSTPNRVPGEFDP
ncbi:sigma-70 family RNA polymerase sigma factor [Conexibacter woesei]|uniref:sigma-70 family RNA polymerase sigma factor n=1 Tax=Conexibacter woesei TaxID=191495 RepID=UPI00040C5772|nr:sigma-70 family RNA polymerase sigma factor [Conexibacter woesei]